MIIGISPGRSGSVSLANYLQTMHEFKTLHGKFFSEDPEQWIKRLDHMCETYDKTVGDISWDHVRNIEFWYNRGAEIVVLIRDREGFIDSWWRRGPHRPMMRLFPDFDFNSKEGLGKFYDWFYDEVFKHEDKVAIIEPHQLPRHDNKWENFVEEMDYHGIKDKTRYDETIRDDRDEGVIFDYTDGKDGEVITGRRTNDKKT